MSIFSRRSLDPGPLSPYSKYRPYVREDFEECCAYCLLHEVAASGTDSFELDHFRPKSHPIFSHLTTDFFNLYYACHVCNKYKSNRWPKKELLDLGYGFLDPCQQTFSEHFEETNDGVWLPQTQIGEYTESKIRLNRSHLVEIRSQLRQLARLRGMTPIDWDHPCRVQLKRIISG